MFMTDSMHNVDVNTLPRREVRSKRRSNAAESKSAGKPLHANDAWCIVATDGSTSIISCKSPPNARESSDIDSNKALDRQPVLENPPANPSVAYEPGVDLSSLNMEAGAASKLIAGMHGMTDDQAAVSSRAEVVMPKASTDLQKIFETDTICLVSRPKCAKL
jgi:hypothetical protein